MGYTQSCKLENSLTSLILHWRKDTSRRSEPKQRPSFHMCRTEPRSCLMSSARFSHGLDSRMLVVESIPCDKFNRNDMTAYLSVKGRPYRGRVCCFGETVHGLDPLQAKYKSQWRPGVWLGKDSMDHDLVMVNDNEIVRCKAVRETGEHWNSELLLNAAIGPSDVKRGAHTKVETKAIPPPVPELVADVPSKPEGTSRASKGDKKKVQDEAGEQTPMMSSSTLKNIQGHRQQMRNQQVHQLAFHLERQHQVRRGQQKKLKIVQKKKGSRRVDTTIST